MSAILSECGQYRYWLGRPGDFTATCGPAVFVMLNPSTANADLDDPTIRRCRAFAKAWGCNGIAVVNLYALRSTDPAALRAHPEPVGPNNDWQIFDTVKDAEVVVCAWGALAPPERVQRVVEIMRTTKATLKCLGTTKSGSPRHPLYVAASQPLIDWVAP